MLTIRAVSEADAEALASIYKPYVENTAVSFEYTAPNAAEFAQRIKSITRKYPYLVAEEDGCILGYAYAAEFKGRAAYDRSVETTIYLRQDKRQRGIGSLLYKNLEAKLKEAGFLNMYACIAKPREEKDEYLSWDSIIFHEKQGFRTVGCFTACGIKFDRFYDMIWMEKLLY